jgi:hypothetical protein
MRLRVKGAALVFFPLVLVIIDGVLTLGALGFSLFQPGLAGQRPPEERRFPHDGLRRLTTELALRPEQRDQVERILQETEQNVSRLQAKINLNCRDLWLPARGRIRAVLDGEQQAKLDGLPEEWECRVRDGRHPA